MSLFPLFFLKKKLNKLKHELDMPAFLVCLNKKRRRRIDIPVRPYEARLPFLKKISNQIKDLIIMLSKLKLKCQIFILCNYLILKYYKLKKLNIHLMQRRKGKAKKKRNHSVMCRLKKMPQECGRGGMIQHHINKSTPTARILMLTYVNHITQTSGDSLKTKTN